MRLLIGTDDGLYELTDGAPRRLRAGRIAAVAVGWVVADDGVERSRAERWEKVPMPAGLKARCVLPVGSSLFIGTSEARLVRWTDGGEPIAVEGFDEAPGRDAWHTPWGGPPDTRSLARDADGTLYANVHVGGVLRSTDGERWEPTMEIAADVHQVTAHPSVGGIVLVASARGLGQSADGTASWTFTDDGLHNPYARAVAVAGDAVLMSASDGPRGGRAAVYRRPLDGDGPFERCRSGLPEWFSGNIDTGCLATSGSQAAFGTGEGDVYVSTDAGATWSPAAERLPAIRAVVLG